MVEWMCIPSSSAMLGSPAIVTERRKLNAFNADSLASVRGMLVGKTEINAHRRRFEFVKWPMNDKNEYDDEEGDGKFPFFFFFHFPMVG